MTTNVCALALFATGALGAAPCAAQAPLPPLPPLSAPIMLVPPKGTLRVMVTPLKSQVRSGEVFQIVLSVTNVSHQAQSFRTNPVEWESQWIWWAADSRVLFQPPIYAIFHNPGLKLVTLKAGETYKQTVDLSVIGPPGVVRFRGTFKPVYRDQGFESDAASIQIVE